MVSVSALASLTLFIFTAVCAVSDCLSGKISNSLILCGAACALVSRAGLFLEQELAEGISFSLYYLLLRVFLQIADAALCDRSAAGAEGLRKNDLVFLSGGGACVGADCFSEAKSVRADEISGEICQRYRGDRQSAAVQKSAGRGRNR